MKKLLFILAGFATLAACTPKNAGYIISCKVSGDNPALKDGKAILSDKAMTVSDTVNVLDGKFEFRGKVESPVQNAQITIPGTDGSIVVYFLENARYYVSCSQEEVAEGKAAAIGGKANMIAKEVEDLCSAKAEALKIDELYSELRKPETSPERQGEIEKILDDFSNFSDSLKAKAASANPHSIYALAHIQGSCYDWPLDSIKNAIREYNEDKAFAGNAALKKLNELTAAMEACEVGKTAPDFTLDDKDGNPQTFSDFYTRNKLTMLDFWASWCGPCRAANPVITKVYAKYKDKGFDIFGVSFDNNRENWLKAIETDGLEWTNVSDLKRWDSAAGKLYGIRYIPQNVFVDSEGKIVAKRIEPEDIEAFVAARLGE